MPAYKPYKLVKRIPSKTQHKERNPRHLYFQPGVLVPEKLKLCLRGRAYTSSLIKVYLLLNSACCTLEYWAAQQHRTLGAPSDRKVPRRFALRLVR